MINFKSKIAQKALGYFFVNPQAELYLNEMVREFDIDRGNLVKKLAEFLPDTDIGVIGNRMRKKRNTDLYDGGILISRCPAARKSNLSSSQDDR